MEKLARPPHNLRCLAHARNHLHLHRPCAPSRNPTQTTQLSLLRTHLLVTPSNFSFYSAGFFFSPLFSTLFLTKCGRLRSAFFLLLAQSLFILSFGLSKLVPNDVLFVTFCMLSRFAEGFVCASFYSVLMMMIPSYFPDYSSYFTANSIGLQLSDMLGPVWGGLLYNSLGYSGIFILQSAICFSSAFLLLFFLPHERSNPYHKPATVHSVLGYWRIFKIPVRRMS